MAYSVLRRSREIAIRMALGAKRWNVIWLVMREVLVVLAIGMAAALPAAWGLTQLVKSQLFGITPHDPLNIAAATAGLALVALAAGYILARRATRVDPMEVLRYE